MLSSVTRFKLLQRLRQEEGLRLHPYKDTLGILTIGYGRNLDNVGIRPSEAEYLLEQDVLHLELDAPSIIPNYENLKDEAKIVLLDMAFNMGLSRLSEFKLMMTALRKEDYKEAANQMKKSKWAIQVPNRALSLADLMQASE